MDPQNQPTMANEFIDIKFKMISNNSLEIYREISEKVLDDLKENQKNDEFADNQEMDTLHYEITIRWDRPFDHLPEVLKYKFDDSENNIIFPIPINKELCEFKKEDISEYLEFYSNKYAEVIDPKDFIFSLTEDKICYYYIFCILLDEKDLINIILEYFQSKSTPFLLVNLLLIS